MRFKLILAGLVFSTLSACTAGLESKMNKQFSEFRSIQAEQTTALSELREEVRTLTGRLDEMQYKNQGRAEQLEKSIQQLGNRVPPPAGVPADLFVKDEDSISRINGGAAEGFRRALQSLRLGEYDQAHTAFQNFARENPGTAFTDNALFWSAICSMKSGQPDQAVVEFSDAYQKYPAEDMVAPALYYMAETLFAMGAANDGVLTLQKLVDDHPQSEYAAKAKGRLGSTSSAKPKKKK